MEDLIAETIIATNERLSWSEAEELAKAIVEALRAVGQGDPE